MNLLYYTPFALATGITIYFHLLPTWQPNIRWLFASCIIAALSLFWLRKWTIYKVTLVVVFCLAGVTASAYRIHSQNAPTLPFKRKVINLEATITDIQATHFGNRITLEGIKTKDLEKHAIPYKIRLVTRSKLDHFMIGDYIHTKARIQSPNKAIYPGGYDFSWHAYFKQIGAVGYPISKIYWIPGEPNFQPSNALTQLRKSIYQHLLDTLDQPYGSIMAALLVGMRQSIPPDIMQDLRNAGLAHLLAISGMHVVMVCSMVFFCSRILLFCSPSFAIQHNSRKWAAFISILSGLLYVLLAGMPVSAQRAWIMASIILLGIVIDRHSHPLRTITLAACIILIVLPESLFSPGFQMSFAAALALIMAYQKTKDIIQWHDNTRSIFGRIFFYGIAVLFSSIVAGIATTPFAIYHFNHSANLGLIANLVAIPLTSFITLPFGLLSLILLPINLDFLTQIPIQYALDWTLKTAKWVSNLPHAHHTIVAMPNSSFVALILGSVWLLGQPNRWRYLGVLAIAFGLYGTFNTKKPTLVIEASMPLFAIQGNNNVLWTSKLLHEGFLADTLRKRTGNQTLRNIDTKHRRLPPNTQCDYFSCIHTTDYHRIAIVHDPIALDEDCKTSDLIVNLTFRYAPCAWDDSKTVISRYDLYQKGTHLVFLEENSMRIQTSQKQQPFE